MVKDKSDDSDCREILPKVNSVVGILCVCKFGTDFGNKCGIICADARKLIESNNNLLKMIENMFDQIKEKLENQGLTKNPKLFTTVSFEKVN